MPQTALALRSTNGRQGAEQVRGYTKCHYLTVRCQACETWLHPKAVAAHAQPGRCKGSPWDEELDDARLVTGDMAELFARVLTPDLVGRPTFSEDRVLSPGVGERLRGEVYQGVVVRSPLVSVDSSRWVVVATAAALAAGSPGCGKR